VFCLLYSTLHWAKHYKENYALGKTLQRKQYVGQNTTKKTLHWAKHYKENNTLGKTLQRKIYIGNNTTKKKIQ
jgi:hypothetical protein